MLEQTLSKNVVSGFPGEVVRVEDKIAEGTPDLNYLVRETGSCGWMELKVGHRLNDGRVKTRSKLTQHQVIFLYNWAKSGGKAWLLAVIENCPGKYYTLHSGLRYKTLRSLQQGKVQLYQLLDDADWYGESLDMDQLGKCIL